jgi:hypothetical protein
MACSHSCWTLRPDFTARYSAIAWSVSRSGYFIKPSLPRVTPAIQMTPYRGAIERAPPETDHMRRSGGHFCSRNADG